jgi:hypothetical protein
MDYKIALKLRGVPLLFSILKKSVVAKMTPMKNEMPWSKSEI